MDLLLASGTQAHPGSIRQAGSQPSPAIEFPSSHPSVNETKIESPQIVEHVDPGVPAMQDQPGKEVVQVSVHPMRRFVESSHISGGVNTPSLQTVLHTEGIKELSHSQPGSIMHIESHPSPNAKFPLP